MQVLLSGIAGISILGATLFTPASFLSQYFFDVQQQIEQINVQTLVGNTLESTQKLVPILSKKVPSEIFIDFESEYNSSHNSESGLETNGSYIALNTQPTAQAQLLSQQNNFEQPLLKDAEIYVPQNFQAGNDSEEFEQKLLIQKNFFSKQIDRIYDSIQDTTNDLNDSIDSLPTTSGVSFATVALGGTGLSTAPTYGQLLMGDGLGGYALVSTSSLGISSGSSSQWTTSGSNVSYMSGNVGVGIINPPTEFPNSWGSGVGLGVVSTSSTATIGARSKSGAGYAFFDQTNDVGRSLLFGTYGSTYDDGGANTWFGVTKPGNSFMFTYWDSSLAIGTFGNRALTLGTNNLARLTVLGNGNIAIGTSASVARLTVQGSGSTEQLRLGYDASNYTSFTTSAGGDFLLTPSGGDATLEGNGITIGTTANKQSYLMLKRNNTVLGGMTTTNSVFSLFGGATQANHLTLSSSGNVGIGITSPNAPLSIVSGTGVRLAVYDAGGTNQIGLGIQSNLFEFKTINSSNDFTFGYGTSGSLTRLMTIEGTGNVGIGTTSPYAKLSVVGDFVSTRLHATSDTATSTIAGNLVVGTMTTGVSVPTTPGITLYGDLSFSGGARTIRGSDDAINSGDVNIQGGYMQFSSTGGSVNISGGQGGSLGLAGNVTLAGGAGSSGTFGASGGTVTIRGGLKPSGPYNSVLLQPSGGNVGIGEASPTYPLHVTATTVTDVARFAGSGGTQCTVVTGTGFSCTSDERFKTNIDALGGSVLESVLSLRPVKFNWKYDPEGPEQIGFIAQELEEVFPEVVRSDSDGYKSVAYAQMTPLLVKAIQEQNVQIKNLSLILTSTDPLPQIFIDRIVTALSQITNLVVKKLTADSVTTKELCVEDVCVTREQFLRIIRETGAEAQQEQNKSNNEDEGEDEKDHRDDNNSEEQVEDEKDEDAISDEGDEEVEDENATEDVSTSDDTNDEGSNSGVSNTDTESIPNAEESSSVAESTDQTNDAGEDSLEGDSDSDSSINNNGESEPQQESNEDSDAANREGESDSTNDSDAESANEDSGDGGGDSEGSSPGSGESQ